MWPASAIQRKPRKQRPAILALLCGSAFFGFGPLLNLLASALSFRIHLTIVARRSRKVALESGSMAAKITRNIIDKARAPGQIGLLWS